MFPFELLIDVIAQTNPLNALAGGNHVGNGSIKFVKTA